MTARNKDVTYSSVDDYRLGTRPEASPGGTKQAEATRSAAAIALQSKRSNLIQKGSHQAPSQAYPYKGRATYTGYVPTGVRGMSRTAHTGYVDTRIREEGGP